MAGNGFKPPMPPGVNSAGLPSIGPNPLKHNPVDPLGLFGGGGPQSAQNSHPPTPHLGAMQGRMNDNSNDPFANLGGPGGGTFMPGAQQNAFANANNAMMGSLAQQPQGGAIAQGWGAGGGGTGGGQLQNALMQRMGGAGIAPGGSMAQFGGTPQPMGMPSTGMQLPSMGMQGPAGIGQPQQFGAPQNWMNDTYMHHPHDAKRS